MSDAVGGSYDLMGAVECSIMEWAGLSSPDSALLDFGCGSGRLASALAVKLHKIKYTGIDIDQRLIDFATRNAHQTGISLSIKIFPYRLATHRSIISVV